MGAFREFARITVGGSRRVRFGYGCAIFLTHITSQKHNGPVRASRATAKEFRPLASIIFRGTMASSAAGPTEAVPASTGRKRPRAASAGSHASARRVLIYTTCYNVIDG